MPFEKGNKYWKLRTKHGRERIIQDPQVLADAADEYFLWCDRNPIYEIDFRGKDLKQVKIPHPRVYQKGELARFCHMSEWRLIADLKRVSKDFSQVVTYIEGIIENQKYRYAVVNMFNSNIVARDLGLKDRQDHTTNDKDIDLTREEREQRIKDLQEKARNRTK